MALDRERGSEETEELSSEREREREREIDNGTEIKLKLKNNRRFYRTLRGSNGI